MLRLGAKTAGAGEMLNTRKPGKSVRPKAADSGAKK